jgi:hypothetical protein
MTILVFSGGGGGGLFKLSKIVTFLSVINADAKKAGVLTKGKVLFSWHLQVRLPFQNSIWRPTLGPVIKTFCRCNYFRNKRTR